MRNIIYGLGVLFFMSWHVSYALQIKSIKDNHTALVSISSVEPSRIFVLGDRIAKTRGLEGIYDLKKDEVIGDIFIQPNSTQMHKPFDLFVTTEQGHHFTLLLNPMNIPAETIELKPLSPSRSLASHWEKNSPYLELLVHLIQDMVNENRPDGYAVIDLGKVKSKKFNADLTVQLITLYKGDQLQGEIWHLKNRSHHSIELHPSEFYNSMTRAISLKEELLNSGEETLLYKVVSYGE